MQAPARSGSTSPLLWLATGLGAGYSPVMPGTVGALWGLPLTWAISATPGFIGQIGLLAMLAAVGVPLCGHASRVLGKADPAAVVWDELTTVPLVFVGLGKAAVHNPWVLVSGFILHRFFDILKVPPAGRCERLPGGWGIMADDWVAAAYACLVLHGLVALGLFH